MVAARANRLLNNRASQGLSDDHGVSKARIVQANVVLDHAPDLADGGLPPA